MSDVSTTLQILVKLQDDATSAIQSLGGQVGSSFDQMAQKAREAGIAMVAAGTAITGALGYAVDQASQDQEAWQGLNTTLSALQDTAKEDTSNKEQNAEQTSVLTTQAKALQAQIDQTRYAMENSTTAHKDHAAAVAAGEAKIELLQNKLDTVNQKLQTHQSELALATGNLDDWEKQIEAAAKANVNLGFNADDTAASIQTLVNHTKDINEALQLNNIAMDLARAKHIDLSQAANLVGLAFEGQGKALKQFGINIKDTATPMEALKELQAQVGGQAKDFTDTFAGQMDVMKAKQEELIVTIGNQLLPVLTQLTEKISDIIQKVLDWTNTHPQLTKTIVEVAAVVGPLLILLGSFLIILPQLVAGIGLVGAALAFLAANPVVLIIAGIVALIAAIVLMITHWQQTKDVALSVWTQIKTVIGGAMDTVKNYIDAGMDYIDSAWRQTWSAIHDYVLGIWNDITNSITNFIGNIIGQINNLRNTLSSVASSVGSTISNAYNSVSSAVSGKRASGGSVGSGQTYLVGENGPELFTPNQSGYITPNGGFGGSPIVVYVTGNNISNSLNLNYVAEQVGRAIVNKLKLNQKINV
jgi:phage-related minor tail protein